MKEAYIFRGGPASGKGAVVAPFAQSLGGKVAYLDLDVFRWRFHLIGRNVPEVSDDEHRLAFKNLLSILENYCQDGSYTVVCDGLFTWDDRSKSQGCVTALLEVLDKYGYETTCIILTADEEILKARNQARDYVVPDDEFEELYNGVYTTIDPQEIVIDSSKQNPVETIEHLKTLRAN